MEEMNTLEIEKEAIEAEESLQHLEKESQDIVEMAKATSEEIKSLYEEMVISTDLTTLANKVDANQKSLKRTVENSADAFRKITVMDDEMSARWKDIKKSRKKRRFIQPAPSNTYIDVEEELNNHFAHGLNIYKLLVILIVGSFLGVVIETIWCLFTNGYIESRAGLVYGPFNLLYGAGAVALTVCLYKYRNRGQLLALIGGFIVGSVLEYACSWGQEMLIGSTSWDYSNFAFNLNGRICLAFSFMWGCLGVFWIKDIYPRMARWILKIPNKIGKALTWAFVAFLIFDGAVSAVAVYRWAQRGNNVPANSSFWKVMDERFPDERMEKIYANMEFGSKN